MLRYAEGMRANQLGHLIPGEDNVLKLFHARPLPGMDFISNLIFVLYRAREVVFGRILSDKP